MKVKDLGVAANKFGTNAAAGAPNYQAGVQNNNTWATNAAAAAPTWAAGVQAAAANGTFGKGVSKAGQGKWQANSVNKGVGRFQSAVTSPQAKAAWQAGFQPFATVLSSITVPPRGVRGSPGNYSIVQTIGDALHKAKVSGA